MTTTQPKFRRLLENAARGVRELSNEPQSKAWDRRASSKL